MDSFEILSLDRVEERAFTYSVHGTYETCTMERKEEEVWKGERGGEGDFNGKQIARSVANGLSL